MRFDFVELPRTPGPARPAIQVRVEDLDDPPQLCLVDTGSTANRFGAWVADAIGIALDDAPRSQVWVAGLLTTAVHARVDLTVGGIRYDAPVTFCDPWPFPFGLLGQEGFLRFFRLTLCAAEGWLELEPEPV